MKFKLIAFVLVVFLSVAGTALAAEFIKSPDGMVNIPAGATHHNLYTAGNTVNIASNITGDLVAAGNSVTVSGSTQSNMDVAGNSVKLDGNIGNNLRAAGNNVEVNGNVGGDILAAGSNVRINGSVAGDVVVAGRSLEFGPKANVTGHIKFYGQETPIIEQGAKVGAIEHISPKAYDFRQVGRAVHGFGTVVSFFAWLIASLVLVWLFRPRAQALSNMVSTNFGANIGYGTLGLIVAPIVVVILFVTLVGYYVAFLVLLTWLLLLMLSGLIAAVWVGAKVMSWYHKSSVMTVNVASAIVGVIIFKLVALIPVIGWLACAILCLVAFGAVLRSGRQMLDLDK